VFLTHTGKDRAWGGADGILVVGIGQGYPPFAIGQTSETAGLYLPILSNTKAKTKPYLF
jgi:hypothetical protein